MPYTTSPTWYWSARAVCSTRCSSLWVTATASSSPNSRTRGCGISEATALWPRSKQRWPGAGLLITRVNSTAAFRKWWSGQTPSWPKSHNTVVPAPTSTSPCCASSAKVGVPLAIMPGTGKPSARSCSRMAHTGAKVLSVTSASARGSVSRRWPS